jgi:DNA end-binding protein Ku
MAASIWKGSISFGLLNIPVTLLGAERDKEIHFSMLDKKDLARIRYKKVNAKSGKEIPYNQIVKGYEYTKNRYVIIDEADFKKANVKATQTLDIEDFVLMDEMDPVMFEKFYYLAPQKGAEKGYFLLRDALLDTKKVAIAKIVIRVKQHLGVIMPRGDYLVLELMRFSHQVKKPAEVGALKTAPKKANYSDRELKMAEDLIKGMTSKWKPDKYKDTYYDDVMKIIKSKVTRGKGHYVKEPEKELHLEETSNVVDLMPLLQKSLAAKKGRTRRSA